MKISPEGTWLTALNENQITSFSAREVCAAVVVTCNPDLHLFQTQILSLCPQIGLVIVVDNGSEPFFRKQLDTIEKSCGHLKSLFLEKNYGIAYAQNIGIEMAIRLGFKYVLLLDHDSIPAAKMVSELYKAAETLRKNNIKLAAVGARLIDQRSFKENGFYRIKKWRWIRLRCGEQRSGLIYCQYLNASGSLHPTEAFDKIGRFNEFFFIDHVDTDWFMRAQASGYSAYGVCSAKLYHAMGDKIIPYWFFGWHFMPHRSPNRHYYIVRNALWLYRMKYTPLFWKLNNLIKIIFTLIYFVLFDNQRKQHLIMILKGLRDGFFNNPGAR